MVGVRRPLRGFTEAERAVGVACPELRDGPGADLGKTVDSERPYGMLETATMKMSRAAV